MASKRLAGAALNVLNFSFRHQCRPVLNQASQDFRKIHTARLLDSERRFTKDHEWIKVTGDIGTVGISDHAQNLLGDIVYVELPEIGKSFEQHDVFGVVESVKAASDLYSPVSGETVEVNTALEENPELINKEPYDSGWVAKMKLSNSSELDDLMNEETYLKFVEESEEE